MEKPVAYLSLCLHCYNLVSEPRLDLGLKKISHTGFSEKMHRQLEQLFADWGLPDE